MPSFHTVNIKLRLKINVKPYYSTVGNTVGLAEGDEPMRALADSLEAALQRRGFARADKPFASHLTVGRVRVPADWTQKLAGAQAPAARFTVDRILLMKSTLSPRGSVYEVVSEAKLGG